MRVPAWRSPPCRGSQAMAMHRGRVIFARFEIVLVLATNAWADTSPSKTAGQGNAATAIAKIYVSAREWDAAKKQLETALGADPANAGALQLLAEVVQQQREADLKRQWALVADAAGRWREGDFDKAREIARRALEGADPRVIPKIQEILDREAHGSPLKELSSRFKWPFDLIATAILVLCLYIVLNFVRWCRTLLFRWRAPNALVLRSFQDSTVTGAGDLAWSALLRFRAAQPSGTGIAGLLNVQQSRTPEQIVRLQQELALPELPLKD